ncbi:hypothetical protein HPB52_025160 [Rhipicephalus sanguineus]|uniref:Uncharacterized protein n=1 Tax=Rhipicephalus sanguineus TaxID=34632 RepID=A0A9D4YRM4_RHISA|nr:hypothetical protein HPB52_025160 [Rhipicephalus sanguineus]
MPLSSHLQDWACKDGHENQQAFQPKSNARWHYAAPLPQNYAHLHVSLTTTFATIEADQCFAISALPSRADSSPPGRHHSVVAANLQDLPPPHPVRWVHPVNSPFRLTVADSARAQAYLCITSLTVSGTTFTVHLYAPPPEDALRGILSYAFDDFKDEAILEDLQASNPTLSIVGAAVRARLLTFWSPSTNPRYSGGFSSMVSTFVLFLSTTR